MTFAGKAILFWLAYAVIFSIVVGVVVTSAQPQLPKQVDLYEELLNEND